ncbi:hypothetical protein ACE1TI_20770 [Alteribacillus sp. JSM 102045]|uniref:hypothetical protein n=1 Tax=Alteribacillus sp. JSM 102045 TaxID=1562101 RepID=UPI0035C0CBAE
MAKNKNKQVYGYESKIGEEVAIYFLDGKVLRGKLIKVFQYDMLLEVTKEDQPIEVNVFKGSVKYII